MSHAPLIDLYKNLLAEYGSPSDYWPQWCAKDKDIAEREKIIIGMILVQRTTWHNANIALRRLKNAGLLALDKIADLHDLTELTDLIRPAGFFQSKPQRLVDICKFVRNSGGVAKLLLQNALKTRADMLEVKGVGKETADTILLYALDKPNFIIDEYTYRWADMHGISHTRNYDELQNFFQSNLPQDIGFYQNLHALIIILQRGREKAKMEIV